MSRLEARRPRKGREGIRWSGVALGLLLIVGSGIAQAEGQESPWSGDFLSSLVGRWAGTGVVYGNPVELDRTWSFDLADQFLRADMGVRMASGGSFRVVAYWGRRGGHRYEVIWMDELGETTVFEAMGNSERREVTAYYMDQTPGDSDEWRKLTIEVPRDDTYRELMFAERSGVWEQIAEFEFTRERPTGQP